jgi:hypothetical protein
VVDGPATGAGGHAGLLPRVVDRQVRDATRVCALSKDKHSTKDGLP